MTVILGGVVGSTAYGLAREGSDVDRLGFFVAPTVEVAGLEWHPGRESIVQRDPDVTLHEVGKACRLLLKCNPTVTELLWLDEYEDTSLAGQNLLAIRRAFLSERAVRDAYAGYAHQQAVRLRDRADGSFSSNTRGRTVKHARHLLRLLRQGRQLLSTGELRVRVEDPADYWAFDDMTTEQMLAVYERERALFEEVRCVLPARPDRNLVSATLGRIRLDHLH